MHLFRANRLKPTFLELNSLFHTYIVNKETTNYLHFQLCRALHQRETIPILKMQCL